MGKTAIVTGGENKDACAMGVLAMNLARVTPGIADEFVIYHDGISKKDMELINSIFPTRFIEFSFPIRFSDKLINSSLRGFTGMVFYKYEMLKLVQEYDRVILTDYDVIIQKDLSELKELNGLSFMCSQPLKERFWKTVPADVGSEYDVEAPGLFASLIVADSKWKSREELDEMYRFCVDSTHKYARYIKSPEECIMTMMIQHFKLINNSLEVGKYSGNCRCKEPDPDASILHAVGRPKFWDGLDNEVWNKRYEEWLRMGGSPYHEPLKRRLIRYTYDISARKTIRKLFGF